MKRKTAFAETLTLAAVLLLVPPFFPVTCSAETIRDRTNGTAYENAEVIEVTATHVFFSYKKDAKTLTAGVKLANLPEDLRARLSQTQSRDVEPTRADVAKTNAPMSDSESKEKTESTERGDADAQYALRADSPPRGNGTDTNRGSVAAQLNQVFLSRHDFTVHLPGGWIEVPKEEIRRVFKALKEQSPNVSFEECDYAYQLGSSTNWFEYPYIGIQVKSTGKLTGPTERVSQAMLAQITGQLKQECDKTVSRMTNSVSFLESASLDDRLFDWDPDNRVVWTVVRARVANFGPIATVTAICFTETGVMRVMLAVKESEFSTYVPMFHYIVNSIEYGPSLKYRPVQYHLQTERREGSLWEKVLEAALQATPRAIAVGILAGVITLIIGLRNKRQTPQK